MTSLFFLGDFFVLPESDFAFDEVPESAFELVSDFELESDFELSLDPESVFFLSAAADFL